MSSFSTIPQETLTKPPMLDSQVAVRLHDSIVVLGHLINSGFKQNSTNIIYIYIYIYNLYTEQ